MLALKTMKLPLSTSEHVPHPQLPSEVLDGIAGILYEGSYRQPDSLFAFSLVSKHFRKSTLPYLFGTVSHVIRDQLRHGEHGLLRRLATRPGLVEYAHTLHVLAPVEHQEDVMMRRLRSTQPPAIQYDLLLHRSVAAEDIRREYQSRDFQLLRDSLALMHRLRRIRLDCSPECAERILKMLPEGKQYEVILDRLCTSWPWPDLMQATTEVCSAADRHCLGLGAFGAPPFRYPGPTQATFDLISEAAALKLHMAWLLGAGTAREEDAEDVSAKPHFRKPLSCTELGLVVERASGTPRHSLSDLEMSLIPWTELQRLSIDWQYSVPMGDFLHSILHQLFNLRALHLRAYRQRGYHPACPYEAPPGRIFDDPPDSHLLTIDYDKIPRLEELAIDGICNHIAVSQLVGGGLRSLRLHREDNLFSVHSVESQRCHRDILLAAQLCPELEHLELDVGYIENLWQSVAVPGVDVDVGQYAFLNAISKFRRLKFLRLFPPFVARGSPHDRRSLCHRLPVADYQAVRIFEHLRNECPSLQLLSIAATPSFVNVDTMSWEVRKHGDTTILTTGHKMRNYQHRQTWIGLRRIRSEIRRFEEAPAYLPESKDWWLSRKDRLMI
ncbi:hypothetical protein A1O7_00683 [Cladophialophora yegresii CBS 114405]|uniref:Uncharacterized protein n=1 Tax=Cladophialophora yegresii CBS 114405 TaxID=1182544 RepID=W9W8F1_9EURO|nr:uncharacterized protein A1O7_00683 [Cladophialophora yegresii CBS 114405]EXJ64347.1 hypothetical protein A1O7_00683 [Cladophialophora yegresii CBS 114405]